MYFVFFQEASVENAWEFVTAPSLTKFSQLPRKRAGYLIEEAMKVDRHPCVILKLMGYFGRFVSQNSYTERPT